jgi:hypothetical protein
MSWWGDFVAYFAVNSHRSGTQARDMRMLWKVIRLDGPLPKEIGLAAEYGVVISTDAMLAKAQSLLFCPLISGIDKDGKALGIMPWHVEVAIEKKPEYAGLNYSRILMSTKIVLPTALNEIDSDGLERGWLNKDSQRKASEKLKDWLPNFRDLTR